MVTSAADRRVFPVANASTPAVGVHTPAPVSAPRKADYEGMVLPGAQLNLCVVRAMLASTLANWQRFGSMAHFKTRKNPHHYWNAYKPVQLRQLIAIADVLIDANGNFVSQRTLLQAAREVDATTGPVLALHHDGGAPRFVRWVSHCLSPAAGHYLFERGTDGHANTRGFFFAAPINSDQLGNMLASVRALQSSLNGDSVAARLRTINLGAAMALLPDRRYQRVLRALVFDIMDSKSFLKGTYGWSEAGIDCACDKVSGAMAASLAFAERDSLSVPSNLTVEGADAQRKQAIQSVIDDALSDEHGGGRERLEDLCIRLGLSLGTLMEEAAAKVGGFSYEEDEGTALAAGQRRDSTDAIRDAKASWGSIAKGVLAEINRVERERLIPPNQQTNTVSEASMRRHTAACAVRSLNAARHNPLAAISTKKLTSASEAFNIDAQPSNAFVRLMEQSWAEVIEEAFYRLWDDHAKWENDKKRGYTARRTVMLSASVKNAPYSDMGMALGGIKAVTNTMLVILPRSAADATHQRESVKRETACFKLPTAVTRLESELRSTPAQQINDWRYMVSETELLSSFANARGFYKFSLSDNGWDHGVRFFEVQYVHTRDHLAADRNYDCDAARAAKLSSYNEAEHQNSEETSCVTKAEIPSLLNLGPPRNAAELKRNRRAFLHAIGNALKGGTYAGSPIVSRVVTPEQPVAPFISEVERLAARKINDAKPEKRSTMPMAKLVLPVLRYKELHSLEAYYHFQLARNACKLSNRLGRLCEPKDYPFSRELQFQTCSERRWRGRFPAPDYPFLVDPPFDPARPGGHYSDLNGMRTALRAGTISPTHVARTPAEQLKEFYAGKSVLPSTADRDRLARELLGSDNEAKCALIDRWFSERRMNDFVKEDQRRQREANQAHDKLESEQLRILAEQMLRLARRPPACVAGIAAQPGSKADYKALLNDSRVGLNTNSKKRDELMERIVENREFIIQTLNLDREAVYSVISVAPVADTFRQTKCPICRSEDYDTDNPFIFCDGDHNEPVGFHIRCIGLFFLPSDDWLCKECTDSGNFLIKKVFGKRTRGGKVEYYVSWVGHGDLKTWQLFQDVPPGSRRLLQEYNEKLRQAAQASPAGDANALDANAPAPCNRTNDGAFSAGCVSGSGGAAAAGIAAIASTSRDRLEAADNRTEKRKAYLAADKARREQRRQAAQGLCPGSGPTSADGALLEFAFVAPTPPAPDSR